MSAKGIFEQVIARGGFDLTAMLARIDEYHIEGKLDDDERDALYTDARAHAHPQYDYGAEIEAIWTAIRALQAAIEGGAGSGETEEWPEYVRPTGAHDAYCVGDKVTFNGRRFICVMDNCVWSPDVYPAAWEEQTDPAEEVIA